MAVFNLPMEQPGDTLRKAYEPFNNMLQKLMEQKVQREQLAEQARAHNLTHQYNMGSLAETTRAHNLTHQYNMGHLAIQRAAENRAQSMVPYLRQQYEDTHKRRMSDNQVAKLKADLAQREYENIINSIGNNNNGNNPNNISQQQEQQKQPYNKLSEIMPTFFNTSSSPQANNNNMQYTPIANQGNFQASPMGQQQQEQLQPSQQQQDQEGQEEPKETLVRPPRPGEEFKDKMVGSQIFGGKNGLKNIYKDGYIFTEYPSGKITKIPEKGLEKGKGADKFGLLSEKEQIQIRQENRKKTDKIIDLSKHIHKDMRTIGKMINLMEKHPDLTGVTVPLTKKIGLTRKKEIGEFNDMALDLQKSSTKELSSRGGYGAAQIVQASKPNIRNSSQENLGLLNSLKSKYINSFLEMKKDYEELNPGKEYPDKLENYFKTITVRLPDDRVVQLPTKGALQLLSDHPNVIIEG